MAIGYWLLAVSYWLMVFAIANLYKYKNPL